ncbi:MAG TPA: helix-turn-helix transcriptional regulator [Terracidiphilus sp.]|jgi:predicted XRE-type DNA-binding protein
MKSEDVELVRGSGNVFRDLGHASPDVEQLKAILAAEIIKMLDRQELSVRDAHSRTGIAAADFSRIRNADLGRFTLDRLVATINRLGARVDVRVKIRAVVPAGRIVARG